MWYNEIAKLSEIITMEKTFDFDNVASTQNPELIKEKDPVKALEEHLQSSLEQYKVNQHRLESNRRGFFGQGHAADTRSIAEIENSLESLKKIIRETAQKLGKDGDSLIAEANEEVRQVQRKSRTA